MSLPPRRFEQWRRHGSLFRRRRPRRVVPHALRRCGCATPWRRRVLCDACGARCDGQALEFVVSWDIPTKRFSSKKTRLVHKAFRPELLFAIVPTVIGPGCGEASFQSSATSCWLTVRYITGCREGCVPVLLSVFVDGKRHDVDHSFEACAVCRMQIGLGAVGAETLILKFVFRCACHG